MPTSTTLAAYRSLSPSTLTSIEDAVLKVIEHYGEDGCIYEQIIPWFSEDTREGTIIGRIKPLVMKGQVFRNGEKRVGKSGCQQLVIRHIKHSATVPLVLPGSKVKKDGFMKGLMYAAKILLKESDLDAAKKQLKTAILEKAKTP